MDVLQLRVVVQEEGEPLVRVRVRVSMLGLPGRLRMSMLGLPGRVSKLGLPGRGGLSWVAWARSKSRR